MICEKCDVADTCDRCPKCKHVDKAFDNEPCITCAQPGNPCLFEVANEPS